MFMFNLEKQEDVLITLLSKLLATYDVHEDINDDMNNAPRVIWFSNMHELTLKFVEYTVI